jgi:heme oxygenase (biliverdin-IX-beta and delta-forming)
MTCDSTGMTMASALASPDVAPSVFLREATRAEHASAEAAVLRLLSDRSREGFVRYLERLLGLYAPMEELLRGLESFRAHLPDWEQRRKVPWLLEDLAFFGYTPDASRRVPRSSDLPELTSAGHVLGAAYVLEGATLGGRVLQKQLTPALPLAPGRGGTFLNGYGEWNASMWQTFRSVLDRFGTLPSDFEALREGATRTFAAFEGWLDLRRAP